MQTTKYDVDLFQNQSRQLRNPTSATTATATATNHPINANILHRGGGRVLLRGFQHSLLLQFDSDSMLRLLTVCYHVFHQQCIDLWLSSHKTCPVCRTDLDQRADDGDQSMQEQKIEFCTFTLNGPGHSIVMIRGEGRDDGDDDKYTLRLPENVALKIVKGGHNYSKICSSSKDMARLNAAPCKKVMFKLYLTVPHPVML
ncbi:hypothetical protein JHK82_025723 [Glycine max]|nr:hypothetical protein JHK85_026339 [Glycine max]KAG5134535.1 hypothetical protein JHK82_025723 [Glycine max]